MSGLPTTTDRELIAVREFDAPRELVFACFTEPAHIRQWWGPRGFTAPVVESDLRPGGIRRIVMRGPDGTDYPGLGRWLEIDPPARLVYADDFDEGEAAAPHGEMRVTVTFEDLGGRTRLTFTLAFATAEELDAAIRVVGAREGLRETLDELEDYLARIRPA